MNIKFTKISTGLNQFIIHNCWDEMGLERVDKTFYYTVIDKSLFMLAVIKHGIEFKEV